MSGIAEVLVNLGYEVSGSDLGDNAATAPPEGARRPVIRATRRQCRDADAVVTPPPSGPTTREVHRRRPPDPGGAPRPDAGRADAPQAGHRHRRHHGKTTTTSLVASILAEGRPDPTFVIGGKLNAAGANARLGKGDFLVAEADDPTLLPAP